MKLEFKGVFPAPPTPVTQDGDIHEKALRALLEDNIAHGAHGFWMAGSTGEGPILTDEQRDAVARISGETCQGRALVIMHAAPSAPPAPCEPRGPPGPPAVPRCAACRRSSFPAASAPASNITRRWPMPRAICRFSSITCRS
jgi:hypothetical protein